MKSLFIHIVKMVSLSGMVQLYLISYCKWLFKIASHHKCMLSTVDIRGAFRDAEFTEDTPIYLKINKDGVPHWTRQDPAATSYVSPHGELILLLDRYL